MLTKTDVLQVAKPILFNTDMVRAIQEERKTVTRRIVRYKYDNTEMKMHTDKYGTRLIEIQKEVEGETYGKNEDGTTWHKLRGYIEPKAPYKRGDYLYVRETWLKTDCFGLLDGYFYKANETPQSKQVREEYGFKWRPSIHMPKDAARIFLYVTDVHVEQLNDMEEEDAIMEGFPDSPAGTDSPLERYSIFWDKMLKKDERNQYGWYANPWVRVIQFKKVEIL